MKITRPTLPMNRPAPPSSIRRAVRTGNGGSGEARTRRGRGAGQAVIFLALCAVILLGSIGCQLPGRRSAEVAGGSTGAVLQRCAEAAEGMHFKVKAIDHSHHVVVAEGQIEGGYSFHTVRLSLKVTNIEKKRFKVEAIATADERGIRSGVEKKARKLFFRQLEKRGGFVKD